MTQTRREKNVLFTDVGLRNFSVEIGFAVLLVSQLFSEASTRANINISATQVYLVPMLGSMETLVWSKALSAI